MFEKYWERRGYMQLTVLLAMISSLFPRAIPAAIAGLGSGEILMILLTLLLIVTTHIVIPIVVIFLLYQWWKNKKEKS